MRKALLFIVALWVGFFLSVGIIGHGGLIGPELARAQQAAQRTMGPTFKLTPGQTFTLDDGTTVTIKAGQITDPPSGFVPYAASGGTYWECATIYKLLDGNCKDGEIVHYWNPKTGEKQDVVVKKGKFTLLPMGPQSRLELNFGAADAYAAPGESGSIAGVNFTVLDTQKLGDGDLLVTVSNDNTGAIGYFIVTLT